MRLRVNWPHWNGRHNGGYGAVHGPKSWPWWRWIVIRFVRHDPFSNERKFGSWNVWIYTRSKAYCGEVAVLRKGQ